MSVTIPMSKLDEARDRAASAIQKLSQNQETAEEAKILMERFEELKERHQSLQERGCLDADGRSPLREEDMPKFQLVKAADGFITCTLLRPDGQPIDESLSFRMKPFEEDDGHTVDDVVSTANDLVGQAMDTICDHADDMRDFQLEHLADMHERLEHQRERLEFHSKNGAPESAREIAATFYFSDALRFLSAAQLVAAQVRELIGTKSLTRTQEIM